MPARTGRPAGRSSVCAGRTTFACWSSAAVVVFHAATAYLGGPSWYFMQRVTSGAWSSLVFPGEVIAAFALGPLFLVAGWFSARSVAHRGAGAFARARLLRLASRCWPISS
jgi:hypothetical protein